jgi:co-chaperonin GroES (HSP10)
MNESGIYPAGNRVLVFVDQIEDKQKDLVIELLRDTIEAQQASTASGTLIDVGPDAFSHITERTSRVIDGELRLIEVSTRGYSEPFAEPGDRVSFAKFAGQKYTGKDGKRYLVLNDEDITCKLDEEVELSDLKIREGVGR